jgi:hypothetical protein
LRRKIKYETINNEKLTLGSITIEQLLLHPEEARVSIETTRLEKALDRIDSS